MSGWCPTTCSSGRRRFPGRGTPWCLTRTVPHRDAPIRIGVSACLLGQNVRYDGGHKKDAGLRELATPRRHANVLQHMLGYVSPQVSADERQELLGLIDDHRRGLVPLVVPLALLRHHVRRLRVAYLQGQVYLDPHPKELMLRNHS